jgi:hypothetical protein
MFGGVSESSIGSDRRTDRIYDFGSCDMYKHASRFAQRMREKAAEREKPRKQNWLTGRKKALNAAPKKWRKKYRVQNPKRVARATWWRSDET